MHVVKIKETINFICTKFSYFFYITILSYFIALYHKFVVFLTTLTLQIQIYLTCYGKRNVYMWLAVLVLLYSRVER